VFSEKGLHPVVNNFQKSDAFLKVLFIVSIYDSNVIPVGKALESEGRRQSNLIMKESYRLVPAM
jgi:hypothetical protein